jgi:hypothetical protein
VGQEKGRLIWPQAWPQTGKKSVGFTATACRVLLAARRTVLCSSAFSLAPPLRSTGCGGALFARFLATSGRPTSPSHSSSATASGLPDNVPAATGGDCWRSPGSRAKGFCACQGLRRRGVGMCLAISTPAVLLSVGGKTPAPRTCLTPLNTSCISTAHRTAAEGLANSANAPSPVVLISRPSWRERLGSITSRCVRRHVPNVPDSDISAQRAS